MLRPWFPWVPSRSGLSGEVLSPASLDGPTLVHQDLAGALQLRGRDTLGRASLLSCNKPCDVNGNDFCLGGGSGGGKKKKKTMGGSEEMMEHLNSEIITWIL